MRKIKEIKKINAGKTEVKTIKKIKTIFKTTAIISAVTLSALFISGCGNTGNTTNTSDSSAASQESTIVTTDGSTSMEKVIGFLSEGYSEEHNNVKITYNPTGSGSGIKAVQEGRCDIGLSSRNLKDEEKTDLNETVVALDAIAVIVNPENTIEDLTINQISALYKGEITNWKDLGGNDSPVVLIGREAASGTRDGFESITKTEDQCKYSQELTSTGDVIQTVASTPNAVGYASLASVKDTVKILKADGVLPTIETVQNGEYKICRNFVFVTSKETPLPTEAKAFFDFASSNAADELITKAGAVPIKR